MKLMTRKSFRLSLLALAIAGVGGAPAAFAAGSATAVGEGYIILINNDTTPEPPDGTDPTWDDASFLVVDNESADAYTVLIWADAGGIQLGWSDGVTYINTDVWGELDARDNLNVRGTVRSSTGDLTVDDAMTVTGAATLSSTLGVTGDTTVGGTLGVTGATTLSGATAVNNTLDVSGATTLTSTLDVTGATTLNGATTVNNTLNVTGATTLDGATAVNNTFDVDTDGAGADGSTLSMSDGIVNMATADTGSSLEMSNSNVNMATGGNNWVDVDDTNGVSLYGNGASATFNGNNISILNNVGDGHGLVVGATSTTLSGGTTSTTLTLNDTGAYLDGPLDMGGNQINNLADGVADTDAATVGQLNALSAGAEDAINAVADKSYTGIASVAALAAIPEPAAGKQFSLGVGYGHYAGEDAMALGFRANLQNNISLNLGVGHSSGNTATSAGVGYSW